MQQYYWTWVTLRGGHLGKDRARKETKNLNVVDVLNVQEYRNLKLDRATIGIGQRRSKKLRKR
jgi:hypothetical protein